MIALRWVGVVATERAEEYVAYVDATGMGEYRRSPGCALSAILTRDLGDGRTEVTAFSIWDDESALRRFTGPDVTTMVLYPEDHDVLLDEPELTHTAVHALSPTPTRGTP